METSGKTNIFEARRDAAQAEQRYAEQLEEFAAELEALRQSGAQVRVKGFPVMSTIRNNQPDGGYNFVSVACAPLIPVEGEPEQPWERTGMIVGYKKLHNDLRLSVGPHPDSGYITFSVRRMVDFEILDPVD